MLTFVFGAGASNDAIADEAVSPSLPPPLSNDLFNPNVRSPIRSLIALFPEAAGLIDHLRRTMSAATSAEPPPSLETELRVVRDLAASDPALEVGLLAIRHYLQRLLWDAGNSVLEANANITNYVTLLYKVERLRSRTRIRVDFVTFNYDFLLERALEYEGHWAFDSIASYVSEQGAVFKPHGSVDWGRVIIAPQVEQYEAHDWRALDRLAGQVGVTAQIERIGEPGLIRTSAGCIVPAIAIPVDAKSQYECPEDHLAAMWARFKDTRVLVTLGWKAGEQDFVQRLASSLRSDCEIEVVTRSEAGALLVEERFRKSGVKGPITRTPGGFSAWLAGPRLGEILNRAEVISTENAAYRSY